MADRFGHATDRHKRREDGIEQFFYFTGRFDSGFEMRGEVRYIDLKSFNIGHDLMQTGESAGLSDTRVRALLVVMFDLLQVEGEVV